MKAVRICCVLAALVTVVGCATPPDTPYWGDVLLVTTIVAAAARR